MGTNYDNMGVSGDLRYGLPDGFELGTNALYDAVGFVNADSKWNFLDTRWIGLAAKIGLRWINPKNLYPIPKKYRDDLGDIDIIIVPVQLTASFPFSPAFGAHLTVGYNHSNVFGTSPADSDAYVDGMLGAREVYLTPTFTFYPRKRVALLLGAQLPVWVAAVGNVTAETQVSDGVVVGASYAGYRELDATGRNTLYLAAELQTGSFHARFAAIYGLRFLTTRVEFPLPSVEVYWRF